MLVGSDIVRFNSRQRQQAPHESAGAYRFCSARGHELVFCSSPIDGATWHRGQCRSPRRRSPPGGMSSPLQSGKLNQVATWAARTHGSAAAGAGFGAVLSCQRMQ